MTTKIELTKIPHLEVRRAALPLLEELKVLEARHETEREAQKMAWDTALAPLTAAVDAAQKARADAMAPLREQGHADDARRDAEAQAIQDQINDLARTVHEEFRFDVNWTGFQLCDLTQLPLFESDATLGNDDTAEIVLRAALGLPDIDDEADSDAEDADADAEAA